MDNKSTDFPQYRKLANGLRFYKINSLIDFEELQILGENVYYFKFVAEQYPDKLRVMDMISLTDEHFLMSNNDEWEQNKNNII